MQSRAHTKHLSGLLTVFLGKLSLDRGLVALGKACSIALGDVDFVSNRARQFIDGQSRCLRFCFQSGVLGFAVPS